MVKNSYTQKDFENDLNKLEKLIKKNSRGGSSNNNRNNNNNKNNNNNNNNNNRQRGGKIMPGDKVRHFKVIEVDGKPVDVGYVEIKLYRTPLAAAKKCLRSIAVSKGMKGSNKLKLHTTYYIQETTQGSKKKVYGPYKGHYKAYTNEEKKNAKGEGRQYGMIPVVKLMKKSNSMKMMHKTMHKKNGMKVMHKKNGMKMMHKKNNGTKMMHKKTRRMHKGG